MSLSLDATLGLPHAFPSSPTRPPRFGFYFHDGKDFLGYHTFYSTYAAARFIKAVINDQPYKWASDSELELDNGITIKAEHFTDLEAVIEHKDNQLERQWELPSPHISYVRRILGKRPLDMPTATAIDIDNGEPIARSATIAPQKASKQRPAAPKARKTASPGITTLAQLADQLQLDPRHCRAALRKAMTKPADGWQWDNPADILTVTNLLKENVK